MTTRNISNALMTNKNIKVLILYLLALFIGFVALCYFYPLSFIFTDEVGFYTGDSAQHVSGFYAFRDTPWHFPIFFTNRLNYPEGVSIINTDSIPIMALLVKPFIHLFPPNFHYFRLWYLFVFLLQAFSAVFLMRQMGRKRLLDSLIAVSFAVIMPCFTLRYIHVSLMTQGILLLALALYFWKVHKNCEGEEVSHRWFVFSIALISVSFLIHAYFTAMILPIYWAAILDGSSSHHRWNKKILECCYPVISLVILFFAFWYYPNSVLLSEDGGYGDFSMNLFAPFVGGEIIPWPGIFQPASKNQVSEGLNYMGLGSLLLFIVAMIMHRKQIRQIFLRYRILIIILIFFTIFALSNKIYAGKILLWEYPPLISQWVGFLGSRFRSTGRFFWIVGYCITFCALVGVLSRKNKAALWIVLISLIVQWVDVPKFNFQTIIQADIAAKETYPPDLWERLLSGKDEMFVMPAMNCGSRTIDVSTLQLLSAKNQVLINTVYGARNRTDCEKKQIDSLSHLKKGTVHVFLGQVTKNKSPVSLKKIRKWVGENTNEWCRQFSRGIVCIPDPDERDMNILNSELLTELPKK